jgi:hypothetical protein
MTQPGLLAHLSSHFAHSEEDLATEALTFLLRTCPAAVTGVRAYVKSLGVDLPADLAFHSQVGDPQSGRPDLVATDDLGSERLIIEAKFWANLTGNQPSAYLTRLAPAQPSMLLVVAPQVRLATLWTDLLANLTSPGAWAVIKETATVPPAPSDTPPATGRYVRRLPNMHVLALASWRAVLDAVDERLHAAGEMARAADLAQLRALTERMDQRAFIPLRAEDLDTRNGRQVHSVALLVDRLRDGLKEGDLVERDGQNSSHGRVFYGWRLRPRLSKKRMWVGFYPGAWANYGRSPLWVQIEAHADSGWAVPVLRSGLRSLTLPGGPGVWEEGDTFLIPLTLIKSAGETEVIAGLRTQLFAIAKALDDAAPDSSASTAPSEPDVTPRPDGAERA